MAEGDRADVRWPKPDFATAVTHEDGLTGGNDQWSNQALAIRV
jgi:hypothetical protein